MDCIRSCAPIALGAALLLGGCPEDPDGGTGDTGTAPTSSSTQTTTQTSPGSTTTQPTSSSGQIDDPEEFCAQFTTPGDCSYLDDANNVYCEWVTVTPVLDAESCMLGEPIGSCLALTGSSTAEGCGPPPGCEGDPYYLDVDGVIRVILQCGGSLPLGTMPCTSVEPGVFDPPECACLCEEPTGTTG